jgi:acylphosphatase
MADERARLEAVVHGRVQGVGFRYFILDIASDLGLSGWVANERDGCVRCEAEGNRADLERLLELLERGPSGSRVTKVDRSWSEATGRFAEFHVRSGHHLGD